MQPPSQIQNVAQWEEHCRKIRARALDLVEGRAGVIVTARALQPLAVWTGLQDDPDLVTFNAICSETDTLPAGPERKQWASHALAREDVKIREAEDLYREIALQAADRLVSRFGWALAARKKRRNKDVG
jgi:hypothetical protein